MIECYLHEGKFGKRQIEIENIASSIEKNRKFLWEMPAKAIIEILDGLGKSLVYGSELKGVEGISFLSMWLRKQNLNRTVGLNFREIGFLDGFVEVEKNHFLKAQPRGIVCHWIAGNVPILAAFSLFQSVLCKNGNILRVPKTSIETVVSILKRMEGVETEFEGKKFTGKDILKTISVVYFESSDRGLNEQLSMAADCKVAWGGKEAVDSIRNLPQREHCETIVFGPKYSFGVVDRETIESGELDNVLRSFVTDIALFDQKACSSPHVLFFEKSRYDIREIAGKIADKFRGAGLSESFPGQPDMLKMINRHAEHYMDEKKSILKERDWAVLVNQDLRLEEPLQYRNVFIKEVGSVLDVVPLITRKVQTIGMSIKDKEKESMFADAASYRGAARCVRPGMMNNYENPWDGMLVLSRLVRWASLIN